MKKFVFIALFGTIVSQDLEITSSQIVYSGNHPLHAWTGVSTEASGSITYNENSETGSVRIEVPLSSFDSKLSSRDSNMLYYTEALDYPAVVFQSSKVTVGRTSAGIEGKLTFHGVTRPLKVTASFDKKNKIVKGDFSIQLSDFEVERPSLLFVKIDDDIAINFKFEFK